MKNLILLSLIVSSFFSYGQVNTTDEKEYVLKYSGKNLFNEGITPNYLTDSEFEFKLDSVKNSNTTAKELTIISHTGKFLEDLIETFVTEDGFEIPNDNNLNREESKKLHNYTWEANTSKFIFYTLEKSEGDSGFIYKLRVLLGDEISLD